MPISPFLLKLSLSSTSSSSSAKVMKHKVAIILKQVAAALSTMARSSRTSAALKNKTAAAIFKLLRSKKRLLIKLHSLLRSPPAAVMLGAAAKATAGNERIGDYEENAVEELFPDLELDLEREEEEEEGEEQVAAYWAATRKRWSEELDVEEEIDRAADAFIRRFHWQMRLENDLVELEKSLAVD